MFVNRCLLNLESDTTTGAERGVSPGAIDTDALGVDEELPSLGGQPQGLPVPGELARARVAQRPQRVLQGARVLPRPERHHRRSVEEALRELPRQPQRGGQPRRLRHAPRERRRRHAQYLHVFARTHNAPYKYFYRRGTSTGNGAPWERVPLDIRVVEDPSAQHGENSGVHLVPVVWKQRLFLFWPEFRAISEAPSRSGTPCRTRRRPDVDARSSTESHCSSAWLGASTSTVSGPRRRSPRSSCATLPDDVSPTGEKDYLLDAFDRRGHAGAHARL